MSVKFQKKKKNTPVLIAIHKWISSLKISEMAENGFLYLSIEKSIDTHCQQP